MRNFRMILFLSLAVCAVSVMMHAQWARGEEADDRAKAAKQLQDGNWKDAYAGFSALAVNPKSDPARVAGDLDAAVQCLRQLGRRDEIDALVERVVEAQPQNWHVLAQASRVYFHGEHYGYIVAGKFYRGNHRGGGNYVYTFERDRVRALQLMLAAIKAGEGQADKASLADLHWSLAQMVIGERGWSEAWKLQDATDIATLPDYEENYRGAGGERGAPVDADGSPLLYGVPGGWDGAQNDGERWRWALAQVVKLNPDRAAEVETHFAEFLCAQFDVHTMGGIRTLRTGEDGVRDESGPYAVQTLQDTETIARLATGIKRFTLPDEFNYIQIFQRLAERDDAWAESAARALGQIYENRRQYDRAAAYWKKAHDGERVKQILGNWGRFEPIGTQPAGQAASVDYVFRNGNKAVFTAYAIDVVKLLDDVKAYLKKNPKQLEWEQVNIDNIGYRLVEQNQSQYIGEPVVRWTEGLTPLPNHFDTRKTVVTPLKKGGAYLLTAQMADGNTSRIVLWVADTVIVKKPLNGQIYYYVADALTGKPIPGAQLDFFGYNQEWVQDEPKGRGAGHHQITTASATGETDAFGQYFASAKDQKDGYNWVITATGKGRLAYLGFTGVWYGRSQEVDYNAEKAFVITDRPVYRPAQTVKFKFWVNKARYDSEGNSPFAGKKFTVRVNNPKGEKVYEKALTADQYGGFNDELALPKDATLGSYSIRLNEAPYGGGSFRVEEYKKPEFEVSVEAPTEPVMLGDRVTATIKAKYYFGAPVTNAKVKVRVLRTSYSATWYPAGRWDWYYGKGYWWYAADYPWYPGWRDWGCMRPVPIWWGYRAQPQPEVVMEDELPLGEDGTLAVPIETSLAKALFGDTDHRYEITAEVTDQSRRTITGQGQVLVARKPFKVYAWVNRGHYRVGDVVQADFSAQTLDNRPVQGNGLLRLYRVTYQPMNNGELAPVEKEVQQWELDTNAKGTAHIQMKADRAGQYRLSYTVRNSANQAIEGGYVFNIRGAGFDGSDFRFNDLELLTDKREYAPGEQVQMMLNTNREDATVLLFLRPSNGVYLAPKVLTLHGKSALETIDVLKKDMPNFFIEAVTVSGGKVFTETREVVVPPEQRILNVDVLPSAEKYQPGEKATVKVRVTDTNGKPYQGSTVVAIYDKSVEYIAGGGNIPEIKRFFWQWRRSHHPNTESSLNRSGYPVYKSNETQMDMLGVFGTVLEEGDRLDGDLTNAPIRSYSFRNVAASAPMKSMRAVDSLSTPDGSVADGNMRMHKSEAAGMLGNEQGPSGAPGMPGADVEPQVRSNFADTALWAAALETDANGIATVELTMPENLTTWKARVWTMGNGARVGEGTAEMVTAKNLILRLQAPRFFVQKDEVVLSANVHNYLPNAKNVRVVLELDGDTLRPIEDSPRDTAKQAVREKTVMINATGEQRVDWRVKVLQPGEAVVRMKAITDEESDAMEMRFPVYVHGMLKTESATGVIRPEQNFMKLGVRVPAERRPEQTRLEVRYSPTLAGAMVDAIPYLVDYPYGCTEQTLNRFLPTVVTQNTLKRMGVSLQDIRGKRTNLNAQEIGDDQARMAQWKRYSTDAVYDEQEVAKMTKAGVERLGSMQCADGGWGWFSGWGEQSYPHTTAVVVHGLQLARANGVTLPDGMLQRGLEWLKNYQETQIEKLKLFDKTKDTGKAHADAMDAFIYMVLVDEKMENATMRAYLYRDRTELPVYAKCMFGLALHTVGDTEKRNMLIQNIDQYLVQDDENQTAYLKLPGDNAWWYWYGSEYEAQAYYLKLLSAVDPQNPRASRLVKYLLNNRKNATYWNSTRDTAIVLEAFADYLKASGEDKPNMTVTIKLDGKVVKTVTINNTNLFSYDNAFVVEGAAVTSGDHLLEITKDGTGPLYFNAYLTNFTLEDPITKAGLEIKVNRKYYKLERVGKTVQVEGNRGQSVAQQVVKYNRVELQDLSTLKSGDLVEIELEIDAKNDYEYILFEDMKPAGFEPVDVRSGYGNNDMGAYMELRDERVAFFVRSLARGKHSISYRMRAEIPGQFNALPTRASALYAPELKANSDELKLRIVD